MYNLDTQCTVLIVKYCYVCKSVTNQVYIFRENKTISITPATHRKTSVRKLSKYTLNRIKTIKKLHEIKKIYLQIPKTTETPPVITLKYIEDSDYESLENTTYESGEYDEKFTLKLIKKYNLLTDLEKLYMTTTQRNSLQ